MNSGGDVGAAKKPPGVLRVREPTFSIAFPGQQGEKERQQQGFIGPSGRQGNGPDTSQHTVGHLYLHMSMSAHGRAEKIFSSCLRLFHARVGK